MVVMINPSYVGEVHFKIMVDGTPVEMTLRSGQKIDLSKTFKQKDLDASLDLKTLFLNRTLIKV